MITAVSTATLCALLAQNTLRAQDGAPPANLLPNGDFGEGMKGVEFWDPRNDDETFDREMLPRTVASDHPEGGLALLFPAYERLQTTAMNVPGLTLRRGHNLEMTVVYKSSDPDLSAYAEVVLQWATWPNIARLDLKPGNGWQTATINFKATRQATVLTAIIRNPGANVLHVNEIIVKQLPDDDDQLPMPRVVQPGETQTWTEEGTWAFRQPKDEYTDEALFTLRPLNDEVAGGKGWIKYNENGDFVRGDGSPIRFWSFGTHGINEGKLEDLEEQARFLAKRGVNLIRWFTSSFSDERMDREIDALQRAVTVMKKQGIYAKIGIYWKGDGRLFWDPERQAMYKRWWRELLTRPNPHCPDNTPLKDDPAFAIMQIQNEDSWLFWSMWGSMWNKERRDNEYPTLNAMFKQWLADNNIELELDEASKKWFFEEHTFYTPDSLLDFRFWEVQNHGRVPPRSVQLSMRFSAELMRRFNESITSFIRDDIGCPVLINAGNWYTADNVRLNDLERWSYDGNDVIGVNRYVDMNLHVNENGRAGWLIEAGDFYVGGSCLSEANWRTFSPNVKQTKGKPLIIPESSWVYPNLYQAEGPFMVAAYTSLTGIDALCWFQLGTAPGYEVGVNPWIGGLWKWPTQFSPSSLGGFPAASWMYQKGYVERGSVVVDEKRNLEGDMWELRIPIIAEDSHFDPNQPGTVRAESHIEGGVPFGAFMIGPVQVEYGKDASGTTVDLNGQDPADLARGVVRSNTGELFMNAPGGLCTLDAPCAQGVTGFLKAAGPQTTSALEINLDNDYGTVLAVSLDDKPLSESGKILLQITTLSRPDGWAESPVVYESPQKQDQRINGFRIDAVGRGFWNVKNTLGTVAVKNAGLTKATLADANFYAAGEVPVERQGGKLLLNLPPNAMYVVLE